MGPMLAVPCCEIFCPGLPLDVLNASGHGGTCGIEHTLSAHMGAPLRPAAHVQEVEQEAEHGSEPPG
jgi:hypothetical protein